MTFNWSRSLYYAARWAIAGAIAGMILGIVLAWGAYRDAAEGAFAFAIVGFWLIGWTRLSWDLFRQEPPNA